MTPESIGFALRVVVHLLIFSVLIPAEGMASSRYVRPQASLSANGARALDLEAENVGGACWRRQVDVA